MKYPLLFFISISFLVPVTSCSDNKATQDVSFHPVEVTISHASRNSNYSFVSSSGKIEAENSADISSRVMGYVTSLNVKIGQKVSRGQLLATISNVDLNAQKSQAEAGIIQARAAFDNAKKDYDRFLILFEKKSATQKELDDMTTRFNSAKAGLDAARQMKNVVAAQLAYTRIVAPFSGEVTNTFVKSGEMANPGHPLLNIAGDGRLQAVVMIPENKISRIRNDMTAEINIKSLNKKLKGKVSELSNSATRTGGQFLVKINLENPSVDVLPGMFVEATFSTEKVATNPIENNILIPERAIVKNGQLDGVYIINESGIALLRWLRLGKSYGDDVEVLSGLSDGEKYVLEANEKLFNGAKVIIQ